MLCACMHSFAQKLEGIAIQRAPLYMNPRALPRPGFARTVKWAAQARGLSAIEATTARLALHYCECDAKLTYVS